MITRGFWARRRGRLALKLAFWAVITPLAVVGRAFGADRLGRKPDPRAATYWRTRDGVRDPIVMTDPS